MSTEVAGNSGRALPAASRSIIDRSIPIPYYYQLENLLRAEIERGTWAPDRVISSERQLCEQYGVSRTTVRQAVSRLVQEGLLYHVKGKGTFVTRRG
jgi:GntR family transcriptional regulator